MKKVMIFFLLVIGIQPAATGGDSLVRRANMIMI